MNQLGQITTGRNDWVWSSPPIQTSYMKKKRPRSLQQSSHQGKTSSSASTAKEEEASRSHW